MTKEIGRKYIPKLANMHQVCEVNYGRLLRLLPDCDTEDLEYQFRVNASLLYTIKIIDCSPLYQHLRNVTKKPNGVCIFTSSGTGEAISRCKNGRSA